MLVRGRNLFMKCVLVVPCGFACVNSNAESRLCSSGLSNPMLNFIDNDSVVSDRATNMQA